MNIHCAVGVMVSVCVGGCGGAVTTGVDSGPSRGVAADASPAHLGADDADFGEASAMGAGPVDASGEPSSVVMTCGGPVPTVSLKLPCLLGGDLGGGYNVLECQLSGTADTLSPRDVAISMILPLRQLSLLLGQPVSLPFDNFPQAPPIGSGQIAGYAGEGFVGSLTGMAVFSQVDPVGRAFVGRLEGANVVWNGSAGDAFSCTVVDGAFWAVAGGFL